MAEIKLKYRESDIRRIHYFLQKRFSSVADLPSLLKVLIAEAVAEESQKELDEARAAYAKDERQVL